MSKPRLSIHRGPAAQSFLAQRKAQETAENEAILRARRETEHYHDRIWRTGQKRSTRCFAWILRAPLFSFVKTLLSVAQERGAINGQQVNHLTAIAQRRLWPEKDVSP